MATYRVYAAYENAVGGIEGCGAGSEEFDASSAEAAARTAAEEWCWLRGDWDGGDVIVATDDNGDSYHLHREGFAQ